MRLIFKRIGMIVLCVGCLTIVFSGCGGGGKGGGEQAARDLSSTELSQFADLIGGPESVMGMNIDFYMTLDFSVTSLIQIKLQAKKQNRFTAQGLSGTVSWNEPDANGWYQGTYTYTDPDDGSTTTWTLRIRFYRSQNKLEFEATASGTSGWVKFDGSAVLGSDGMPVNATVNGLASDGTAHRIVGTSVAHYDLRPACSNPIVDPVLAGTVDYYRKPSGAADFYHAAHITANVDLTVPSKPYIIPQSGSWYFDGAERFDLTPSDKRPLFLE